MCPGHSSAHSPLHLALRMDEGASTSAKTHGLSHPSWTCTRAEGHGNRDGTVSCHQRQQCQWLPLAVMKSNPTGLGHNGHHSWKLPLLSPGPGHLCNLPISGPKKANLPPVSGLAQPQTCILRLHPPDELLTLSHSLDQRQASTGRPGSLVMTLFLPDPSKWCLSAHSPTLSFFSAPTPTPHPSSTMWHDLN